MATFVNDLRLKEIATGDESGTWGTSTNTNLELIAEAFSFGTEAITTNADTHTTTIADGATDPGRSLFLKYTGTLDSACTITIGPNTVSKLWFIENATSGSQSIIISQGSGANITILNGQTKAIYSDGAGSGAAMVDAFTDLSVPSFFVQGNATITTDDNTVNLNLISTDADADSGPELDFYRNSGSPADDDLLGRVKFIGRNDNSQDYVAADIFAQAIDVSDGSEDSSLFINSMVAGVLRNRITITPTEAVINEGSVDLDFRVESDNSTNALFVEGSSGAITFSNTLNGLNILADTTNFVDSILISQNASTGTLSSASNNTGLGDTVFAALTSGHDNTVVGKDAGKAITSGEENVIVGHKAGDALTDADFNVAVGRSSLTSDTLGSKTTAVGHGTLNTQNYTTATDSFNVAVGYNAGAAVTTGTLNTFIGGLAGDAITTAAADIAIGHQSLSSDTLGSHSVGIGFQALTNQNFTTATDVYNVAVGSFAGRLTTTGVQNTLVGGLAGDALTDADFNTAVGYNALTADTLGSRSTAIGRSALQAQNFTTATDVYNVGVGYAAGAAVTTGVQNTLIGGLAGDALTTANNNVAIGYQAHSTDDLGSRNISIGSEALSDMNFATATDSYNVAVGDQAGKRITTGIQNTLIGALAGDALSDADSNVAIGTNALASDTLGSQSVAIGRQALFTQNFTTATNTYNVAVGANAGLLLTTGTNNTLVGALAGDAITTGSDNTAMGYLSLSAVAGSANVAYGYVTLIDCTGSDNTAIGYAAGFQVTSGTNNLLLGHDAGRTGSPGGAFVTGVNGIVLGDENITNAHIQVALSVASDERDKTGFVDLDLGLNFVKALEPVTFYWDKRSKYGDKYADDYDLNAQTPDGTHKEDWLDIGFKAQEVIALEEASGYKISDKTNLVSNLTDDGTQYSLKYDRFVPILVKAIQEQQTLITALTDRIAALEG